MTRNGGLRTWIEISKNAVKQNVRTFRKIISPRAKLWSVVKSNAYGHGITVFPKIAGEAGVDGFCVDSLVEGLTLRKQGTRKPILVMGFTIPSLLPRAGEKNIAVGISTFEGLAALLKLPRPPFFHIKVDTGMHRHGFYLDDLAKVVKAIHNSRFKVQRSLSGLFTHFAVAKDRTKPRYTEGQFKKFMEARRLFEQAGFRGLTCHASATGGALMSKKYHLDAVRIGMGLCGYFPSRELESELPKIHLKPVLSWRTLVGEVKPISKGDCVGYDVTERAKRSGTLAILPVGYWHGLPRSLSSKGEVLIRGRRAKIMGRISMDITAVNAAGTGCSYGDIATLVGKEGHEELRADAIAELAGTSHYEILTRINPLIERRAM